jgi:hypothetical protein
LIFLGIDNIYKIKYMGTKRFILTENERKNILNLYNYKGILKNYTSNLINEGYDDTYKNYWKWCSVGLNPNAKNKNLNYSKIANNLLSGIEGAGTYKNTIRTWLNSVTYCGDLIEVEKNTTYKVRSSQPLLIVHYPLSIHTYDDHRMAMGFAPWATLMNLKIEAPEVVNKSYPGFWEDMKSVGFNLSSPV